MHPIKQVNSTTYEFEMPSGDKVEVGNRKSDKFETHLKINRWDGECFIAPSIELTGAVSRPRVSDKQIEIESNLSIVRFYPMAPSKQWELGSFRMEITHKKKPKSNKIVSNILSHNVVAHYQPPLTEREKESGITQEDNMVGSYAFYHATKGRFHRSVAEAEKYRCCKVGHKPRPRVVDDNGDWCWADLYIDLATGLQVITIPQEFLEYAKYPIRHDAGADTFGYTTIGTALDLGVDDDIAGAEFACPETGTAISISAALKVIVGAGENHWAAALYQASDDALVSGSSGEAYTPTTSYAWYTIARTPGLTAQTYAIICCTDIANYNSKIAADANSTNRWYKFEHGPGDGWPNPYDGSKITGYSNISIYCTYTPEAPPAGHPTMKRWGGVPYMEPRGRGVW